MCLIGSARLPARFHETEKTQRGTRESCGLFCPRPRSLTFIVIPLSQEQWRYHLQRRSDAGSRLSFKVTRFRNQSAGESYRSSPRDRWQQSFAQEILRIETFNRFSRDTRCMERSARTRGTKDYSASPHFRRGRYAARGGHILRYLCSSAGQNGGRNARVRHECSAVLEATRETRFECCVESSTRGISSVHSECAFLIMIPCSLLPRKPRTSGTNG